MRVLPSGALNCLCTELVHGWVFYDRHGMALPPHVERIGVLAPGNVVLVLNAVGSGIEYRFIRGDASAAVVQNQDGSVNIADASAEYGAAMRARMLYLQRKTPPNAG